MAETGRRFDDAILDRCARALRDALESEDSCSLVDVSAGANVTTVVDGRFNLGAVSSRFLNAIGGFLPEQDAPKP